MGNVLSGDERRSSFFVTGDKKPKGIVWIDEQFGYRTASKSQRKAFERKRKLYYDENRNKITRQRQRSQSLGAIIPSDRNFPDGYEFETAFSRSFIPRIKLNRDMPIKEDFQYSSNMDVYNYSKSPEPQTTTYREQFILHEKKDAERNMPETRSYNENDYDCDIMDKPEENYFTKNFNECMKRLEIIEKEHEIMEADGERNANACNFKKPLKRQMTPPPAEKVTLPPPQPEPTSRPRDNGKPDGEREEERAPSPQTEGEKDCPVGENNGDGDRAEKISARSETQEATSALSAGSDASKTTRGWYSSLKKQFENQDQNSKEASSCRVTGAKLKSPSVSTQTLEKDTKEVRHYFSRLVRSNKSLIDEELPDPDKVQNIRAMFQESLNSTLQKNINNRLGGSLQNINVRPREDQFARPKSAQGNRNDYLHEFRKINNEESTNSSRTTLLFDGKESKTSPGENAKGTATNNKNIHSDKSKTTDPQSVKPGMRKILQPKWTDTTSLSSGVSSDLSSFDTDAECCSREEIEENTTDEELHYEEEDKHYVRNETLEKIRSFGTSVTYFGGQMITCSVGPLLSPTTQAILNEIGEKYPERTNLSKTFEEFYRKYTESNEPRRKKLGRTRSFGQNDVFHKPNILNDTEIEMYKNDLEIEIGIRKPSGRNQNTLKQKLVKSNSVGSRLELFERDVVDTLNEILEAAAEMAMSENGKNEEDGGGGGGEEGEEEEGEERQERQERQEDKKEEKERPKPKESVQVPPAEENKTKEVERSDRSPEESPKEFQPQVNELLFGYEKELFQRERKSDMEFEEFEVCETVEEKIEKLEENPKNYRLTLQVNHEFPTESEDIEEIVINEQEPLDSLEIYLKARKSEETPPEPAKESCQSSDEYGKIIKNLKSESGNLSSTKPNLDNASENGKSALNMRNNDISQLDSVSKHWTGSKWPLETSVMIDIQKTEEQTPKLVTTGKSSVKTKTRSFKK